MTDFNAGFCIHWFPSEGVAMVYRFAILDGNMVAEFPPHTVSTVGVLTLFKQMNGGDLVLRMYAKDHKVEMYLAAPQAINNQRTFDWHNYSLAEIGDELGLEYEEMERQRGKSHNN